MGSQPDDMRSSRHLAVDAPRSTLALVELVDEELLESPDSEQPVLVLESRHAPASTAPMTNAPSRSVRRVLPAAAALLALAHGACGGSSKIDGSSSSGGAASTSASSSSSAVSSTSGGPFAGDAVTCAAPPAGSVPPACCPEEKLRPLPTTAASVLDLSDPTTIAQGTCGTYDGAQYPQTAVHLSLSPADYPMKIILPALAGADPACSTTCPDGFGEVPPTAFGIAIATGSTETGYLIGGNTGRLLAISVPPPWFFVSGGCGEACAWPCLTGYQEYGSARSCITIGHGDFGFATADPAAPSVEAVVELIDLAGEPAFTYAPGGCCLYGAPP